MSDFERPSPGNFKLDMTVYDFGKNIVYIICIYLCVFKHILFISGPFCFDQSSRFFFTRFDRFTVSTSRHSIICLFALWSPHRTWVQVFMWWLSPCCDSGSTQEGFFPVFWHVHCNQIQLQSFPVTFYIFLWCVVIVKVECALL